MAETTLTAPYVAGSGTCTVASAAGFPPAGTFRVRLANAARTRLRVTAMIGPVWTVTAEAPDADAAAGTAVIGLAPGLYVYPGLGIVEVPSEDTPVLGLGGVKLRGRRWPRG